MGVVTLIASAIFSQFQTTVLVSNIVSSFVGNHADQLICKSANNLYNRFKNNYDEPANHDIQKAVRKACLNATLQASQKVKRDGDVKKIVTYIKKELALLEKPNIKFPQNE